MEQTKTLATTTLNGSIDGSQTTLVVTSASSFPTSGTFSLMIDSEIMKVTGVSGTTFTVVRGQEGTSGASHTNGATLVSPLTARALEALRAEFVTTGSFTSFTQARSGRIYLPTDAPIFRYDNGSNVLEWGFENLERLYPPVTSDFSWNNQGGATVDDSKGYTVLVDPASSGDSLRLREKNIPTPPWSVTCRLDVTFAPSTYLLGGLYFRESGTSKIRTFEFTYGGAGECYLSSTNWTNTTTYSSTANAWIVDKVFAGTPPRWFKIKYDGTNVLFYAGHTKLHMVLLETKAKSYHFTTAPDKVGFYVDSNNASFSSILNLYSWEEGT